MSEFHEDTEFKKFMEFWDFPLSMDNPISMVRDKDLRVQYINEIARQSWNYCKKSYMSDNHEKQITDLKSQLAKVTEIAKDGWNRVLLTARFAPDLVLARNTLYKLGQLSEVKEEGMSDYMSQQADAQIEGGLLERDKMISEIDRLKSQLAKVTTIARELAKFYGVKDSWLRQKESAHGCCYEVILSRDVSKCELDFIGGKLARAKGKELDEILGDK